MFRVQGFGSAAVSPYRERGSPFPETVVASALLPQSPLIRRGGGFSFRGIVFRVQGFGSAAVSSCRGRGLPSREIVFRVQGSGLPQSPPIARGGSRFGESRLGFGFRLRGSFLHLKAAPPESPFTTEIHVVIVPGTITGASEATLDPRRSTNSRAFATSLDQRAILCTKNV